MQRKLCSDKRSWCYYCRSTLADPRYPVYNEGTVLSTLTLRRTNGVSVLQMCAGTFRNYEESGTTITWWLIHFWKSHFWKTLNSGTVVNANLTGSQQKEFRPSTLGRWRFQSNPLQGSFTLSVLLKHLNNLSLIPINLSYSKNIQKHRIDALLGFQAQRENYQFPSGKWKTEFASDKRVSKMLLTNHFHLRGILDGAVRPFCKVPTMPYQWSTSLSYIQKEGSSRFRCK